MFEAMQKRYQQGISRRSNLENVGTLLDENGIVLVSSNAKILQMIERFQWKTLFWEHRRLLTQTCEPFLFGHALLAKCLTPYVGMTGHAILRLVEHSFFQQTMMQRRAQVDQMLATHLQDPKALQKTIDLSPFPLLGFPGYFRDAERPSFYENTQYFRSGRTKKHQSST